MTCPLSWSKNRSTRDFDERKVSYAFKRWLNVNLPKQAIARRIGRISDTPRCYQVAIPFPPMI